MAIRRETKVGIGVSLTFACLVCLIVGFKLYDEPPDDTVRDQPQVAAKTNPPEQETPPTTTPPPPPPTPAAVASPTNHPLPPPPGPQHSPPPVPVSEPPTDIKVTIGDSVTNKNTANPGAGELEMLPMPTVVPEPPGAVALATGPSKDVPVPLPPAMSPVVPAPPGGPFVPVPPPPGEEKKTEPPIAPVPAPPTPPGEEKKTEPAIAPIPPAPTVPATPNAAATLQPPIIHANSTFVPAPDPGSRGGAVAPVPAPPGAATAPPDYNGQRVYSEDGVKPTPIPAPPPTPRPIDPAAVTDPSAGRIPAPPNPGPTTPVRADVPAPPAAAPEPATKLVRTPLHIEKTATEATFQELSKKHYGDEKYADALKQFNVENFGATASANGKVSVGQTVLYPDSFDAPETPVQPAPRPAVVPQAKGRVSTAYEVAAGGESLLTITGRADHAEEMRKLNNLANVNDVIPGGTLLKMPADFQAQAANYPH